jgi:peptide/nickel transport system substrate-binding protein
MMRLLAVALLAGGLAPAAAAGCPAVTLADRMGVAPGAHPQQYERAAFEAAAGCALAFRGNPEIAALNARIQGNPEPLPPVAERLPEEPLVVVPYASIGRHGGRLDMLSNASEAGTGEVMALRHVNLVRYADDLQTIVPNVAKGWSWNADYTALTFFLRRGHRWSDGAPFTARDVKFWYEHLALDPEVIARPKNYVLVAGEPMEVEVVDAHTVRFVLPAPKPGLLAHFAVTHAQPYQPRHFLGRFHPALDPEADANAAALGFGSGYEAIAAYYGSSDWMDTPSPMLSHPDKVPGLPKAALPTLESHVLVAETTEGRRYVANPYFHMVDTAGNQLPYVSEIDERYVGDREVILLRVANGEVDFKGQALALADAPFLLENAEAGGYKVQIRPRTSMPVISFNVTARDPAKRAVFADPRFRQAMSLALDRSEINEVAYFGEGEPKQYIGFAPRPGFVDPAWERHLVEHDPERAAALLDAVGLADRDGDGLRALPGGEPFTLNIRFAAQGAPTPLVELVARHFREVGIDTTIREVTSDEYRSAQSANRLDVGIWEHGHPLPRILGTNEIFVPPFANYFGHRNGMLWARWIESDGAEGVEPPGRVMRMIEDIAAFQSAPPGSEERARLGEALARAMAESLLFIGTVRAPSPIVHRTALRNVAAFRTKAEEYRRLYPYLPPQWWLAEGR